MTDAPLPKPPGDLASGREDIDAFRQRLSQAGFDTVSARTQVGGTITIAVPNVLADIDSLPVLTSMTEGRAQLHVGAPFGAGGMGMICRGRQLPLMRDVAVKLVVEKKSGSQSEARELLYEGRVMGMLEHPNIVPVYELGRDERGDVLLVMKHVEGQEWSSMLRGPQRGEQLLRHLEILSDVCRAVEFAHSRSILHRDLKPDNVMVGQFGEVYVLDWGLALSLDDTTSATRGIPPASAARTLAGTPGYMAPEMVLPDGDLTERSDGFLLGAILHHITTGHPRWRGADAFDRFHATWTCHPFEYDATVPGELRAILERSMARDAVDRFDDVATFRFAIEEFVRHESARRLAERADDRRRQLVALPPERSNDADAERLFTEARFGYQQAIEVWPDSPEARAGLRGAGLEMLERAIVQGATEVAVRLQRELGDDVPESMGARVEALRDRRGFEAGELERLAELETAQHVGIGRSARGVMIAVIGTVWCLVAVAAATWIPERWQLPLLASVAFAGGAALLLGQVSRQGRGNTNDFDRFTARDSAAHALAASVSLGVCALAGLPTFIGLFFSHLLLAMSQATLALGFDRRVWVSAALMAISSLVVVLFREDALLASGLAGGGALVFAGIRIWLLGTSAARRPA